MKVLKYLWVAVILISSIWLLINIMSVIGYSITNTYDVVHAKRSIGETAEILNREKEIKGLVTHHIFLIATNIFMIITAVLSIRKSKKNK